MLREMGLFKFESLSLCGIRILKQETYPSWHMKWICIKNCLDIARMNRARTIRACHIIDVTISWTEFGTPLLTHMFCYSIIPVDTAYLFLKLYRSFTFFEIVQQTMTINHVFRVHFHSYAEYVIQMFKKQNIHWKIPWNMTFQWHSPITQWYQEGEDGNIMNYQRTKNRMNLFSNPKAKKKKKYI